MEECCLPDHVVDGVLQCVRLRQQRTTELPGKLSSAAKNGRGLLDSCREIVNLI